ncbi:hypothetical protein BDQ12DRAFT_689008 [Crucibulum laeve]|uniref:DUF6593 domain-containing protein n=1 Tax=Crucibulum laeve TaxID=68775 RepID=A0A5C3LP15_9AGAR|nr:hypothetical protein BDQ12DRAFT_689008 [Crucibulum laeve]
MDSQITLVNSASESVDLVFEKPSISSLHNTVYLNSRPLYTITTRARDGAQTKVFDVSTTHLAITIDRSVFFSDKITFADRNDGKAIKVNDWMKETKIPKQHPIHVMETPYGKFTWKVDVVHRHALYSEADPENPIAYMKPATSSSPMALHLESGTESFREEILGSFLLVEQRMRMKEKESTIGYGVAMEASRPFSLG